MRRRLAPIVISLLLSVLLGSFAAGAANRGDTSPTVVEASQAHPSPNAAAEASAFSLLGIGLVGLALFPRSRFE